MELVGADPCSSFQADGIGPFPCGESVHVVGTIAPLPEVHYPSRLSAPIAKTFARHLEFVLPVRMEDEREHRKAASGDLVGIAGRSELIAAKFVNIDNAGVRL